MNLVPLVQAVEVLMSPLQWGSQDAWLVECLQRVRDARGVGSNPTSAPTPVELESLLRLPGDQPGWMRAALDSPGSGGQGSVLPTLAVAPEALLPVVSLRCALAAGLATLARLEAWRNTLGQAFGDVATGMAIYRRDGARVTANARWAELLAGEPERERLLELIARLVRQSAAASGGLGEEDRVMEMDCESYRLVVSRAAAGTLLPEPAVLVLMDRPTPGLPTTQELRITFGLRGREPQVALLAAAGLSNADIAERLRLSAHTVRHYLERVLDRLGLHTRKALAVHLMAGTGERSPPERKPVSSG